ncbi:MAG: two-component regulator propeller domain-containing protein [Bacteroidia bacterium]
MGTDIGAVVIREGEPTWVYTSRDLSDKVTDLLPEARQLHFSPVGDSSLTFRNVYDILEDKKGYLWFSISMMEEDEGMLIRLPGDELQAGSMERAEVFSNNEKIRFGGGQKLLQAQDGRIWVINNSYRLGINVFDNGAWETIRLGSIFGGDEYATTICQTQNGNIWIGGLGKIYSFDGKNWKLFQAPEYKVPGNKMMLFPALNGSLWVMGLKSKVIYVDHSEERWKTYPDLNFQAESGEESWFLDRSGKVIVHNGKEWMAYDSRDGLIDAPVRVFVSSRGQVWAAGSHEGVAATARLKGKRWERHIHKTLSWGIDYRAVFEDKDGELWFGGSVDIDLEKGHQGGVLQLPDPQAERLEWIHHRNQVNGLQQSNAYGIGQSADGRIWLGGGSLYVYDGKTWSQTQNEDLREYVNTIFSMDSLLLVGSRYYGLFIYDGKTWKQYNTESGLMSNTIISIYADSANSIWVATENDIARFDGKKWVNNIFPQSMNLDFEGGEFLRARDGSCWINKSPREWKRRALRYNQMPPGTINQFITYRYEPDTRHARNALSRFRVPFHPRATWC